MKKVQLTFIGTKLYVTDLNPNPIVSVALGRRASWRRFRGVLIPKINLEICLDENVQFERNEK